MDTRINLPAGESIVIEWSKVGFGSVKINVKDFSRDTSDPMNVALNAIVSLLLAQGIAGVDITTKEVHQAVNDVIAHLENEFENQSRSEAIIIYHNKSPLVVLPHKTNHIYVEEVREYAKEYGFDFEKLTFTVMNMAR